MRRLSILTIFLSLAVITFLPGCGTRTSTSYYKAKNYSFHKDRRVILVSLVNHDTWEAKGNRILEDELIENAEETLTSHGYSVFTGRDITFREGRDFVKEYDRNVAERGIHYHLTLTIEPTELRHGRTPITSHTTTHKETYLDIYTGELREAPVSKTQISGGQSYSYYLVNITGSLIDTSTKEQVWFGRTVTRASPGGIIKLSPYKETKDYYLLPMRELVGKLMTDMGAILTR